MQKTKIEKLCAHCETPFIPKMVTSLYCSKKCSSAAYKKRDADKRREEKLNSIAKRVDDNRLYISIPEAVAIYGVTRDTLYKRIRHGELQAINLGTRLLRIDRSVLDSQYPTRKEKIEATKTKKIKLYNLEPEVCYTIGEVTELFGYSESSVYSHIRQYSIPMRQIGKYVYVPKNEIDELYKGKK